MNLLTARITMPVVAAMLAAATAGASIAMVTVLSGHAPTGAASRAIQAVTLLSAVAIQARAVWRVRDEPTLRYLAMTTAAATTVTLLTFTSLCIGATTTWLLWAVSIEPRAQSAVVACAAATGMAVTVAGWLSPTKQRKP